MTPLLLTASSVCAAWAGMAALCFQSPSQRHRMDWPPLSGLRRLGFIVAAIMLLAASLVAAIATDGMPFGILRWVCQTSVSGVILSCSLPYSITVVALVSRMVAVLVPILFIGGYWR